MEDRGVRTRAAIVDGSVVTGPTTTPLIAKTATTLGTDLVVS